MQPVRDLLKCIQVLVLWLGEYLKSVLLTFQIIYHACRRIMAFNLDTVGGGQCGGLVHIVWCSPRQHFSTKSISVFTQMRCQDPLENM